MLRDRPIHTLAFAHIYWHRVNKALQTSEATGGYWALDKQVIFLSMCPLNHHFIVVNCCLFAPRLQEFGS